MKKNCLLISFMIMATCVYGQIRPTTDNTLLISRMQQQAIAMGQVFIKGDYQTFAKYTYPTIIAAMGGESRMATALANSASSMKTQGMTFDYITFDSPSKIVKSGNELQCTLQQHTTIKLANGRAVATSTLIAISKDGGKNWFFIDTSDKDEATMRKVLPNLSTAIVIPPQQKPVFTPR